MNKLITLKDISWAESLEREKTIFKARHYSTPDLRMRKGETSTITIRNSWLRRKKSKTLLEQIATEQVFSRKEWQTTCQRLLRIKNNGIEKVSLGMTT